MEAEKEAFAENKLQVLEILNPNEQANREVLRLSRNELFERSVCLRGLRVMGKWGNVRSNTHNENNSKTDTGFQLSASKVRTGVCQREKWIVEGTNDPFLNKVQIVQCSNCPSFHMEAIYQRWSHLYNVKGWE